MLVVRMCCKIVFKLFRSEPSSLSRLSSIIGNHALTAIVVDIHDIVFPQVSACSTSTRR